METDVKKNLGTYREKHACGLINGVNLLITQTLIEQTVSSHIYIKYATQKNDNHKNIGLPIIC